MIKKTILLIVVGVIVFLTGYFVVQLNSSPAYWCMPRILFECDVDAQVACGGGDYFLDPEGSWCNGTTCRTAYVLYCENSRGRLVPYDSYYCDDPGGCSGVD